MEKFKRIAIADRSHLAGNVYGMLLKPLGYSLFPFPTLKALKENLNWRWRPGLFLINSNVFGNYFEEHFKWFQKEHKLQTVPKLFLCELGEKSLRARLKKLPYSHVLSRPFYPREFEDKVKILFQERNR